MDLVGNIKDDVESLNVMYIKEQNITVSLDLSFSLFNIKDNLFVIIGNEKDYTLKNKYGKLLCGIVELKESSEGIEERLVLPFSNKILFARINDDLSSIFVVYLKDGVISKKTINMNNKTVDYNDLNDLLDENYPVLEIADTFNSISLPKFVR